MQAQFALGELPATNITKVTMEQQRATYARLRHGWKKYLTKGAPPAGQEGDLDNWPLHCIFDLHKTQSDSAYPYCEMWSYSHGTILSPSAARPPHAVSDRNHHRQTFFVH